MDFNVDVLIYFLPMVVRLHRHCVTIFDVLDVGIQRCIDPRRSCCNRSPILRSIDFEHKDSEHATLACKPDNVRVIWARPVPRTEDLRLGSWHLYQSPNHFQRLRFAFTPRASSLFSSSTRNLLNLIVKSVLISFQYDRHLQSILDSNIITLLDVTNVYAIAPTTHKW